MSAEIHLAFDHPEARAAATAPEGPLDRISLRDYTVEVEIGAFQEERGSKQTLCFNIVVEVRPIAAPIEDDVDRILSYDRITEAITAELAAERLNLLETLAERVADRVLAAPQAARVFVRIEKLDRGPGALGVEIVRAHATPVAPAEEDNTPAPTVAFLSNAALAAADLSATIDRLQTGAPLILCLDRPEAATPVAKLTLPQRRIDLLAIEQNGWVLAARDPRCVVIGTRTELEHAARTGQISVWAPSKIVLDAVDRPQTGPEDALGLALWLAEELSAREFVTVGAAAPAHAALPTRRLG
ncbi:MAG: dihydroneopterin aldolase [Pseudomonadota bacterium]